MSGRGTYSTVFRPAQLKSGEKPYIIKRPNQSFLQKTPLLLRKYQHQMLILKKIHQENPTKSHLFGQTYQVNPKGQSIMKDLGDTDLWKLLETNFDVVSRNVGPIIEQLLDVMRTMIKSDIVHLDIKPENIMAHVDDHEKVHLAFIDFADSLHKELFQKHPRFKICGTTMYMSPELLTRFNFGDDTKGEWEEYVANDLWSLGIVVYILLYGNLPYDMFRIRCKDSRLKRQLNTPWKLYEELKENPELYNSLFPLQGLSSEKRKYVKLVKTLLSMDPSKRFQWLEQKQQLASKRQQQQLDQKKSQKQKSLPKQQLVQKTFKNKNENKQYNRKKKNKYD